MNDTKLLPTKLRIKFYAYRYGLYGFIFLMLFAFAFLLDKHIEAIFIFTSFCLLRYKFPTTFHHANTYWCVFWSILSLWICFSVALPLKYSILSTIIISTILCYILYKVQEVVELKAETAKNEEFSLYECSFEEFAQQCLKCGIRNDRVPYVWDIIRSTMSYEQLSEKYCLEYDSVKHDRYRFKKKLLKKP